MWYGSQGWWGATAAGVFPTTGVLDTFTNTDGTALPAHNAFWVDGYATAQVHIQSNAARLDDGASKYGLFGWNDTSPNADCECFATITEVGTGTGAYCTILLRGTEINSNMDGYAVSVSASGASPGLYRIDNDAGTLIDSDATTFSATDQIGVRAVGSAITGYKNGAEILSATDATYGGAGKLAFNLGQDTDGGANYAIDNFGGGST